MVANTATPAFCARRTRARFWPSARRLPSASEWYQSKSTSSMASAATARSSDAELPRLQAQTL